MNILDRLVADTRELLAGRKARIARNDLEQRPLFGEPRRSLRNALRADGLAFIAEIKKASPSKGIIRQDFDPRDVAEQYTEAGTQAISVLTEPLHFQGALDYLQDVRPLTDAPLLRKDFIVDPYQLIEARAYGADAVLLIAAVLDRQQLFDLHQAAEALGLECLVELYASEELERVDFDQVKILGVNNRDLRTFEVDLTHSATLFRTVPPGVVRVSESGIYTTEDLRFLMEHGADAVLIGESLMRAPRPGDRLRTLIDGVQQRSSFT